MKNKIPEAGLKSGFRDFFLLSAAYQIMPAIPVPKRRNEVSQKISLLPFFFKERKFFCLLFFQEK